MPEMDGYETTEQIRNSNTDAINSKIPVIALTAHSTEADKDKCLEAGMNDYLAKPFQPQMLADKLKKWLPKHSSTPHV